MCSNPARAVSKCNGDRLVGDFKNVNQQSEPVAVPAMHSEEQASAYCWSGAVHGGGSEPRLLANAAGCEFAGIIQVCDTEGSIRADA